MTTRRRPAYLDWVFEYKISEGYGADFSISDEDWHKLTQKEFVEVLDSKIQSLVDLIVEYNK